MKRIAVITNTDRDPDLFYTRQLAESVTRRGGTVRLEEAQAVRAGVGVPCRGDELFDACDMVVCLGGDGTFLKVARRVYQRGLPILGINLGNLGFLTEVDRNDIDLAIDQVFGNHYAIDDRMMLETVIHRKGEPPVYDIALNDAVITRGAISRIVHVKTYVNDVFVDSFPGDGLIISSPTGSTAYSLSAGGPIVEPDTNLLLITPICPHILYSRSFVTKADSVVKAVIDEDFQHNAIVALDGQEGHDIRGGDVVEIKRSAYTTKLVRMNSRNFFNILRTKIYYRGESLKKDEIQQACKNSGTD
jgi:NAD+ kinase